MKITRTIRCFNQSLLCLLLLLNNFGVAFAQGSSFTYQGRLTDSSLPANGTYDFQFGLFDSLAGGTQVGATNSRTNVAVANGTFTVSLDFGASAFPGASRFLEIGVRLTGGGAFTTLSPRQPVTSTPYAIQSLNAATAANATTATTATNFSGTLAGEVTGTQSATALANNAVTTPKIADANVTDAKIVSVAGSKVTGSITTATIPGANVTGTLPVASVPAGSGNYIQNGTAQQATSNFNISGNGTVGGMLNSGAQRQESTSFSPNLIQGFLGTGSGGNTPGNSVTPGVVGATIGGGGFNGSITFPSDSFPGGGNFSNRVTDWFGTIGGGWGNTAGSNDATLDNGFFATVGGGGFNTASGKYATVSGGQFNTASGNFSFAAGQRAKANHQGSFVWADSTQADFASFAADQFLIRATGGVGIGTGLSAPLSPLTVNGVIESRSGGIKFPDGTTQMTAVTNSNYIQNGTTLQASSNFNISGNGFIGGNVGIGTTTPSENLQIGNFGKTADSYISLRSTGGNLFRTGIKFRHDNDTGGFNIEDDERIGSNGLNFIRFPFGAPVSAMFINRSNGNVGIGTTAPNRLLHLQGAGSNDVGAGDLLVTGTGTIGSSITFNASGTGGRQYSLLSTANGASAGGGKMTVYDAVATAYRMVIDSSGNVGIGTIAPTQKLTIQTPTNGPGMNITDGVNNLVAGIIDDGAVFGTLTNHDLLLVSGGFSSVVIDAAAGNMFPTGDGSGSLGKSTNRWSAVFAQDGTIQTSDARLKKAVNSLNYGLSQVMQLRPVSFEWKDRTDGKNYLGLIAQEVEKIIPEAIEHDKNPANPLGMSYTSLIPVLIKAMQEQQSILERKESEIQSTNAEINALKAENATLNTRLATIEQLLQQLKGQVEKQPQPKQQ